MEDVTVMYMDMCVCVFFHRKSFFQHMSGADLGILFIDVLSKSGTAPCESIFEQIATLFSIMRAGTPERETFLHDSLRWSMKGGNHKWGHPDLHQKIARVFWRGEYLWD